MKSCKYANCPNPIWGGGYCKNHQYLRKDKKIKGLNVNSSLQSNYQLKLDKKINPFSKKNKQQNKKKIDLYKKMDQKWSGKCTGCDQEKPCSHSHLIPISEWKEGEIIEENITYHCSICHSLWETHNIDVMVTLMDFMENMEYILEARPKYFDRLMNKNVI